jgi:hypothetical protein
MEEGSDGGLREILQREKRRGACYRLYRAAKSKERPAPAVVLATNPLSGVYLPANYGFRPLMRPNDPFGLVCNRSATSAIGMLLTFAGSREMDTPKKGFHNDLRRRQQRIEQARTSRAVWISG